MPTSQVPVSVNKVPRKRKDDNDDGDKTIAFRAAPDLARRLKSVADGLSLDLSNLVRMILIENLRPYERRVEGLKKEEDVPR